MRVPDSPPRLQGSVDNPLEPLAWMLFQIRASLEDAPDGRSPRWVRVAKARRYRDREPYGKVMAGAVGVFVDFIAGIHQLALQLEALLLHVDPPKAVIELLLEAAQAMTDPQVAGALATLTGQQSVVDSFASARSTLAVPERWLGFVPEPVDVQRLGRELFELLHIGLRAGRPTVDISSTGRVRLLAWAFGHPIRVWHAPKGGDFSALQIRYLGMRRLALRDAGSAEVLATWPVGDPSGLELLREDLSKGPDLGELQQTLDQLGYREPALTPGPGLPEGAAERLLRFQLINDLDPSGALDRDTLHRLLNLDASERNICRARPFSDARWRLVPTLTLPVPPRPEDSKPTPTLPALPRSGLVTLVNPDADHPEDEGIAIDPATGKALPTGQKEPRAWYACGAEVPAGSERAKFKDGIQQGWIRHREGDLILPEGEVARVDGAFVALERRPATKTGLEGGALSEGQSRSGRFFFSAREVEPWRSGRTGTPRKDAITQRLTPRGTISGMYQWALVEAEVAAAKAAGERLMFQASCARRSLFKEVGAGQLPDQGRIFLGLARNAVFQGDGRLASRLKPELVEGWYAWSGWWPRSLQRDLAAESGPRALGQDWVTVATPPLCAPDDVVAIVIGLYGKHMLNYDTDAYFDDVQVRWWRVAVPEPREKPRDGAGYREGEITEGAP